MDVNYIGEWLWAGNLGHLLTILGMVAALVATISFFMASQKEGSDLEQATAWKRLARTSFYIHGAAVFGIIMTMFILILYHRFEFKYVWQHSSLELPVHYMISCFWEGQEGSFLLWQFWHVILGFILIATAKKWEASVMTVVSFTQIFLAAMLIGIYFFGYKVGSSPFILMRVDMPETPIFMRANYLEFLTNGNGLNPLLQNYWMVIHPPTLFLGFAATLVPFAYVMAALWKRDVKDWVRPTLIWSLFAGAILGTGILMGGAWAYEALSFGGYWAWDPVENASLVPWIVLIGGIHTLVAYKHSGHALKATMILLPLCFLLILYSTFLTRSGILGDTSVHAFTDLGMSGQLLVFMWAFILLFVVLLAINWSTIPAPKKEEAASSREFWMFVGALILTLFGAIILVDTSWPVINKLTGSEIAITDPVAHYNRYAVWFGMVLAILSATIQYLRYKKSDVSKFYKKLAISVLISIVATAMTAFALNISYFLYVAFLFTSIFVIVANANYIFLVLSGKIRVAGGSVAHLGIGLMLVGILISSANQETISLNTMNIDYGEEFEEKDKRENVLLYKDKAVQMNEYWVTYEGDSISEPNTYYKVKYEKKQNETDIPSETFTLYPNAQINPKMGLIANPDTRHYWTKDVFTHVSSVPDKSKQEADDGLQMTEIEMEVGDTAITKGYFIVLKAINPQPTSMRYIPLKGDIAAGAQLQVLAKNGEVYDAEPIYYIRDNAESTVDALIDDIGMTIQFNKILPEKGRGTLQMTVFTEDKPQDFIIMKAIVFPYINLLWLGCVVMVMGFFISMRHRYGQRK